MNQQGQVSDTAANLMLKNLNKFNELEYLAIQNFKARILGPLQKSLPEDLKQSKVKVNCEEDKWPKKFFPHMAKMEVGKVFALRFFLSNWGYNFGIMLAFDGDGDINGKEADGKSFSIWSCIWGIKNENENTRAREIAALHLFEGKAEVEKRHEEHHCKDKSCLRYIHEERARFIFDKTGGQGMDMSEITNTLTCKIKRMNEFFLKFDEYRKQEQAKG